jgi:hypothetical protein
MIPLYENKETQEWEGELEKQYPDKTTRENVKKGCQINGVLFGRRKIKDSLWDYDEVVKQIKSSMMKLLKASTGCLNILTRRSPLRKQRKSYLKLGEILKR